jgi:hypothetical protein
MLRLDFEVWVVNNLSVDVFVFFSSYKIIINILLSSLNVFLQIIDTVLRLQLTVNSENIIIDKTLGTNIIDLVKHTVVNTPLFKTVNPIGNNFSNIPTTHWVTAK